MAKQQIKPRVIFAGTAQFAVPALEKLLKKSEIVLVLTQPSKPAGRGLKETACPVDIFAQENHLPIFRPTSLKEEAIGKILADYPCDYLIVAAYGKILPQWLLNFPKYRPLNIHGSLLPRWRGASPIQHALLHGDKISGVNLMEMSLGMDEGPILLKAQCTISEHDSLGDLTRKLGDLGADLIVKFLQDPQIKAVPQEGVATYAPKIEKSMGQINWKTQTAIDIQRAFRAFDPWPGLYSWTPEDLRVKVLAIQTVGTAKQPQVENANPGDLIVDSNKLWVLCKDGWIELISLQLEGKNSFSCQDAIKDKGHWIYRTKKLCFREASDV